MKIYDTFFGGKSGLANFTYILVSLSLVIYILYLGASFFIPLLIAIVVWYLIIILSLFYEKIKFPYYLAMTASIMTIFLAFFAFLMIVNTNVVMVVEQAPAYQEKFHSLVEKIFSFFGVSRTPGLYEMFGSINLTSAIGSIASVFTNIAGYTSMILIYVSLLLLEYQIIGQKFKLIFKRKEKHQEFIEIVKKIDKDVKTYIKIKIFVSLITGLLSYVVLVAVGVDFPVFWALLIFILNFIPTIGSIIAVFFPIVLSLIQFSSFVPFIVVSILLITIQMVIGNIIEPKLMGKSLNLSPLVIILALTIWGSIWGVVGMFLCVPIMVILNIVLAKFEKTKAIAIMLSATGKV